MPAPNTQFFTGRMPFLLPKQQHQRTESHMQFYGLVATLQQCVINRLITVFKQLMPTNRKQTTTFNTHLIAEIAAIVQQTHLFFS